MVFFGSMIKTDRMVNAIPLESTLVVSWWSSLNAVSVPTNGFFILFYFFLGKVALTCHRHTQSCGPCHQ